MAKKKRKLGKRLRKSARRVLGSRFVHDVLEDLVTAALLAAAAKLRDSAAGTRVTAAVEELTGESGKGKKKKRKD